MLFRSAALFMATATVAAGNSVEVPLADVSGNSKLGQKIMSKARLLEQNQYNGNYQNGNYQNQNYQQNDGEVGYWVAGYSLKFEKCGTSSEYFAFEGEGGGGDRQGYMQGQQSLAHFTLCPTGSSSGKCASYALPLGQFLELYSEAKMDAMEYNCEMTANMCQQYTCNGNENEDYCMYQCFSDAGLEGMCNDNNQNNNNQNGGYEFDLERASRCDKMEGVDEDQVYYYMQEKGLTNNYYGGEMGIFIGPECSADGKSVYLNVFTDEWCSTKAPSDAFSKFSYGQELPYSQSSGQSMIDSNSISCKEPQDQNDQNNGDQNDADEILEVCERAYENAAKCEDSLSSDVVYYPNTYGCSLINSMKKPGKNGTRSSGHSSAAGVFVGLFAVTTVAFAGVAYYFYQKAERSNVSLSETGEGAMA